MTVQARNNGGVGSHALRIVQKYHPEVTRVVDDKRNIDIEVTRDDCKLATRKSPSSCAMAQAFKRTYDGAIISLSTAYLIKGKKAVRYRVPERVSREIVSFDRNQDFSPGSYELAGVPKALRLGHKQSPGNETSRDGSHVKRRRHFTSGIRSL